MKAFMRNVMVPRFLGPLHWSATINLAMRWELKQRLTRHNLLRRYRQFVITRSDHFYGCPFSLRELHERFVWIPTGEDSGGLCDRLIVCSRRDVMKCLSLIDRYIEDPQRYMRQSRVAAEGPEQFHYRRIRELGLYGSVRRFPRTMYTVAAAGDHTRWQTPTDAVEGVPDLHIKYKPEYVAAKWNCGLCQVGQPFCCIAHKNSHVHDKLVDVFGGQLYAVGDAGKCQPCWSWGLRPLLASVALGIALRMRAPLSSRIWRMWSGARSLNTQ